MRLIAPLAFALACSAAWAQANGDAARGRLLYDSRCVACHSVRGKGGKVAAAVGHDRAADKFG